MKCHNLFHKVIQEHDDSQLGMVVVGGGAKEQKNTTKERRPVDHLSIYNFVLVNVFILLTVLFPLTTVLLCERNNTVYQIREVFSLALIFLPVVILTLTHTAVKKKVAISKSLWGLKHSIIIRSFGLKSQKRSGIKEQREHVIEQGNLRRLFVNAFKYQRTSNPKTSKHFLHF